MKKKRTLGLLILLMMIGIVGTYIVGTFSKYTSTIHKNGNATVAKWDFVNDNDGNSVNMTIEIPETIDDSTLVDGKIAPGTAGCFDVNVVNTNTEVGVDYIVSLDAISNKPSNLKFYRGRNESSGTYTYYDEIEVTANSSDIVMSGNLEPNDSIGRNQTIYWVWEYETTNGDENDTQAGNLGNTLTIGLTITGTQVVPQ